MLQTNVTFIAQMYKLCITQNITKTSTNYLAGVTVNVNDEVCKFMHLFSGVIINCYFWLEVSVKLTLSVKLIGDLYLISDVIFFSDFKLVLVLIKNLIN